MQTDATDLRILAELADNAKASYVEIGKKLQLHPNVIAYRINKLERKGVIREYTADIDLEKIGISEQAYIGANFPDNSEREELFRQIATMPQTVKIVSSLGEPEAILLVVGKNKAEMEKIMTQLRNLNLRIEYTGPIVKIYQERRLGSLLKTLAVEIENAGNDENSGKDQ